MNSSISLFVMVLLRSALFTRCLQWRGAFPIAKKLYINSSPNILSLATSRINGCFNRVSYFPLYQSFSTSIEDTIINRCESKISASLKPLKIKVTSSNDDPNGSHIQIYCVSEEFQGKNVVQRQRMIYKAIWEELNGPVHAVDSIVAKTPEEAQL